MGDLLQPWHLILLAIVAFVLFGAKRLPELGKGIGEGFRALRDGMKEGSAPKAEAQTEAKSEAKPEVKSEAKPEDKA